MTNSISSFSISDESRAWTYALPEGLAPDQLNWVKEQLALFIASWKAHGASLEAGFEIIENRFIILYVNESGQIATGCSIDESISFIKGLSSALKVDMMDRSRLFFRKKGSNEIVEMNFFEAQKAGKNGQLSDYSTAFDFSSDRWGTLKQKFELPLEESFASRWIK